MTRMHLAAVVLLTVSGGGAPTMAQTPAPAAADLPPNDYGSADAWLCRPGRADACDVDLTTTVVRPDGSTERETWTANPEGADRLLLRLPDGVTRPRCRPAT